MKPKWQRRPLGELIEITSGQVDPTASPYADMPHVGGDNIESGTGRLSRVTTARQLHMTSGKYAFTSDHVLYSKIRPNLNKVAAPDFDGICSADIYPLRPLPGVLTREFLVYVLRSADFLDFAEKHSARTNIPKINREALVAYEAPLPPLSEQRRIAAILDQADGVRRKRQAALALTDQFLRSTFLEMFGDPVRNPKGWEVVPLASVCVEPGGIKAGPFGSSLKKEFYVDSGYRVYGQEQVIAGRLDVGDYYVSEAKFRELSTCETIPGDLLLSLVGSIGQSLVVPEGCEPGIINPRLLRIRANRRRLSPIWLQQFLKTPMVQAQLQQNSHGGTMAVLNGGMLKPFPVPLPPLPLQSQFENIVAFHTNTRSRQDHAGQLSATMFNSLVHRAFRGEL